MPIARARAAIRSGQAIRRIEMIVERAASCPTVA
jgi:hypothetical protein